MPLALQPWKSPQHRRAQEEAVDLDDSSQRPEDFAHRPCQRQSDVHTPRRVGGARCRRCPVRRDVGTTRVVKPGVQTQSNAAAPTSKAAPCRLQARMSRTAAAAGTAVTAIGARVCTAGANTTGLCISGLVAMPAPTKMFSRAGSVLS